MIKGFFRLLSGRPQHTIGADGRMALADHLRELRARLLLITIALTVGTVVAWFFYDQLFTLLLDPYEDARGRLAEKGVQSEGVVNGVATATATEQPSDVQMDAETLGALYLSGVDVTRLHRAGRLEGSEEAVRRFAAMADLVEPPYSLTGF